MYFKDDPLFHIFYPKIIIDKKNFYEKSAEKIAIELINNGYKKIFDNKTLPPLKKHITKQKKKKRRRMTKSKAEKLYQKYLKYIKTAKIELEKLNEEGAPDSSRFVYAIEMTQSSGDDLIPIYNKTIIEESSHLFSNLDTNTVEPSTNKKVNGNDQKSIEENNKKNIKDNKLTVGKEKSYFDYLNPLNTFDNLKKLNPLEYFQKKEKNKLEIILTEIEEELESGKLDNLLTHSEFQTIESDYIPMAIYKKRQWVSYLRERLALLYQKKDQTQKSIEFSEDILIDFKYYFRTYEVKKNLAQLKQALLVEKISEDY